MDVSRLTEAECERIICSTEAGRGALEAAKVADPMLGRASLMAGVRVILACLLAAGYRVEESTVPSEVLS